MSEEPQQGLAFKSGVSHAKADIAAGCLQLYSGAPSATRWAADLATTMKTLFGISVVFVGDIITAEKLAFQHGYNCEVQTYVDKVYGNGSFAKAKNDVQVRRKQAYDRYLAENPRPPAR